MKVTTNKQEQEFQPISMTIELETLEEAKAFFAMCLTNDSVPSAVNENWGKLLPNQRILKGILIHLRDLLENTYGLTRYDK